MDDVTKKWNQNFNLNPYKYFFSDSGFSEQINSKILYWLENEAPWKRVSTFFYEQYEFSLLDIELNSEISFLVDLNFVKKLMNFIEREFDVKVIDNKFDIVAHKLVKGDTIGIHNDYIENAETHRILLNFNSGWTDENGGYFMVFSEDDPESIIDLFLPYNGSVHGFEISEKSHHAVSTVHSGERYSVIYSFYMR